MWVELDQSTLRRAGRTAHDWTKTGAEVRCARKEDGIEITASISSAGGGITDLSLTIPRADFHWLMGQMAMTLPEDEPLEAEISRVVSLLRHPNAQKRLARLDTIRGLD